MSGRLPLPREIGSADLFSHRVAGLRSNVTSILRSEAETSELRFEDEGIDLFAGGVWLASLWKSSQSILEIACSHGFGTWRVLMHPLDPNRPTRILAWPSADFEAEVRGVVATLKTGIPPSDRHAPDRDPASSERMTRNPGGSESDGVIP